MRIQGGNGRAMLPAMKSRAWLVTILLTGFVLLSLSRCAEAGRSGGRDDGSGDGVKDDGTLATSKGSYLSRFLTHRPSRVKVNLLPLASMLGLTTPPLASAITREGGSDLIAAPTFASRELTLLSFNVRYDNPLARRKPSIPSSDETLPSQTFGEVSWSTRRHFIADTILVHNPDIFIFQEVLHNQLQDLIFLLGDAYDYVGVGRNDGDKKGEAVPVFWRRDKFHLVPQRQGGVGEKGWEHFWLSDTPDVVGSVGWDADQTRMCTHVALQWRQDAASSTSPPMHIFSTHYDHLGRVARAKSSELVLRKADEARRRTQEVIGSRQNDDHTNVEPLILLGGDLNSPREENGWQNLVTGHHGVEQGNYFSSAPRPLSFIDLQLALPTRFGPPFPSDHFPLKPGEESNRSEEETSGEASSSSSGSGASHLSSRNIQRPFQSGPANKKGSPPPRGILSTLYGPPASFTDFTPGPRPRNASEDRIDFWFMADNQHARQRWEVKAAGTLSNWNQLEGGWRASDHRPVLVRLRELRETKGH